MTFCEFIQLTQTYWGPFQRRTVLNLKFSDRLKACHLLADY
jgi:hypothetical protein